MKGGKKKKTLPPFHRKDPGRSREEKKRRDSASHKERKRGERTSSNRKELSEVWGEKKERYTFQNCRKKKKDFLLRGKKKPTLHPGERADLKGKGDTERRRTGQSDGEKGQVD